MKKAFPAKAKITALVCSGRSRPKLSHGSEIERRRRQLEGDDEADQHADQAPEEGGPEELPHDGVVVRERLHAHVHCRAGSGKGRAQYVPGAAGRYCRARFRMRGECLRAAVSREP